MKPKYQIYQEKPEIMTKLLELKKDTTIYFESCQKCYNVSSELRLDFISWRSFEASESFFLVYNLYPLYCVCLVQKTYECDLYEREQEVEWNREEDLHLWLKVDYKGDYQVYNNLSMLKLKKKRKFKRRCK